MYMSAQKVSTVKLSSTYYKVDFRLLDKPGARPKPLQFVNVWIPLVDEVPMSISDYEDYEDKLSIIVKVVGEGTRALIEGSGYYGVKGFYGNGINIEDYNSMLFVAGGVGIAPLPLLVKRCLEADCKVDVVWGVRSGDMLFNVKSVAPGVNEVYVATEDCSIGYCGLASKLASSLIQKYPGRWSVIVAVGPKSMLRALCENLGDRDVYVSLEAIVKCGLGACGSCTLKPYPKLLCRDGPVFKCGEIIDHLKSP
jgi:dihydroorotate dehydrogenase electron transfer subunit